jgi:hypothetical protein
MQHLYSALWSEVAWPGRERQDGILLHVVPSVRTAPWKDFDQGCRRTHVIIRGHVCVIESAVWNKVRWWPEGRSREITCKHIKDLR